MIGARQSVTFALVVKGEGGVDHLITYGAPARIPTTVAVKVPAKFQAVERRFAITTVRRVKGKGGGDDQSPYLEGVTLE